ncbi:MAG TPA: transposase family protein [Lacunisphaera sp.]|nr:transposase family protein [Lacunisphaera sp.]
MNGQKDQPDPQPKTKITNQQIEAWGSQLNLSSKAIAQIKRMNGSDPVRLGSGRRSVRGRFPSSIMDCTLNFESRTCEGSYLWLRHALSRSNPDRPKMILCQPCWLDIARDPDGEKKTGFKYPPDFFELTDTWAGFIECKWESDLINSQDPNHKDYDPWRYQHLASGEWVSAPAQVAARFYDLSHRIWVMSKERTQLIANLQFLTDYFENPTDNYNAEVAAKINALVGREPGIELRNIQSTLHDSEIDTLFFCIARQEVYIDIENVPIAPNYTARVFPNAACETATYRMERFSDQKALQRSSLMEFTIAVGAKILRDGKEMVIHRFDAARDYIELRDTVSGEISQSSIINLQAELDSGASTALAEGVSLRAEPNADEEWKSIQPLEWPVMQVKFAQIERFVAPESWSRLAKTDRPTRNQFRWIEKCRAAGAKFGPGFEILGLKPEPRKGNTNPRLDADVSRILKEVIGSNYMTKQAPSVELVWGLCRDSCESFNPPLKPPARKTVYRHIAREDAKRTVNARQGPRSAYALQSGFWDEESDGLPVNGEHAWAVAHIDHTELDVETELTPDGLSLGRPWLTVMVCPRQKRAVAHVISYEPPSYRSCMAVMRDCVRRHHRLPAIIVTDNGKEFTGLYFSYLLARLKIVQMFRPPAQARFGAYLERFNRLLNSKLIHNLPGNTKATKHVRELVRAHDPKCLAELALGAVDEVIQEFLYDWMMNQPDPITGLTPKQIFADDVRLGGPRTHKIIIYNRDFHILTCPTTNSAFATVRRDGVKINNIYYWCRQFAGHEMMQRKVHVRPDPENLSVVYVRIKREWVECRCRRFGELFKGISERELRQATTVLLAESKTLKEKRRAINATRLAQFFRKWRLTPEGKRAQWRAQANKKVVGKKDDQASASIHEKDSAPSPGYSPPAGSAAGKIELPDIENKRRE